MTEWTAERDETLRREWKLGTRVTLIANQIGGDATKSSVVGRAHRLKLPRHVGAIQSKLSPEERIALKNARRIGRRAKLKNMPSPGIADDIFANDPIPGVEPKTLLDLDHGDCRYPLGGPTDPPALFCAAPAWSHGPYCWHHYCCAYAVPSGRRYAGFAQPVIPMAIRGAR